MFTSNSIFEALLHLYNTRILTARQLAAFHSQTNGAENPTVSPGQDLTLLLQAQGLAVPTKLGDDFVFWSLTAKGIRFLRVNAARYGKAPSDFQKGTAELRVAPDKIRKQLHLNSAVINILNYLHRSLGIRCHYYDHKHRKQTLKTISPDGMIEIPEGELIRSGGSPRRTVIYLESIMRSESTDRILNKLKGYRDYFQELAEDSSTRYFVAFLCYDRTVNIEDMATASFQIPRSPGAVEEELHTAMKEQKIENSPLPFLREDRDILVGSSLGVIRSLIGKLLRNPMVPSPLTVAMERWEPHIQNQYPNHPEALVRVGCIQKFSCDLCATTRYFYGKLAFLDYAHESLLDDNKVLTFGSCINPPLGENRERIHLVVVLPSIRMLDAFANRFKEKLILSSGFIHITTWDSIRNESDPTRLLFSVCWDWVAEEMSYFQVDSSMKKATKVTKEVLERLQPSYQATMSEA